jgi:hypothetical protein
MDKTREHVSKSPTTSPAKVYAMAALLLQALMWLFTCTGTDAGFAWSVYSGALLGYWGLVWLIWATYFGSRQSLWTIVAVTGWMPPVGCGLWIASMIR